MKTKAITTIMITLFLASITVITIPVSAQVTEVWVNDDWIGSSPGDVVDGHIFGTDAFVTIQEGVNIVALNTKSIVK